MNGIFTQRLTPQEHQLGRTCCFPALVIVLLMALTGCQSSSRSPAVLNAATKSAVIEPPVSTPTAIMPPSIISQAAQSDFVTDIPQLTLAQTQLNYWLQRLDNPDQLLLTSQQITEKNQQLLQNAQTQRPNEPELAVTDLFATPAFYSQHQVRQWILALSTPETSPRFYPDGRPLAAIDWQRLHQQLALERLPQRIAAQFALVTQRGAVRSFPTMQRVLNAERNVEIDRFQETAVFPGQALQVLHYSADQQWAFVRHSIYQGWMSVRQFALTDQQTASIYVHADDFILITGAKVQTSFTPEQPQISELSLDMGVRLPRLRQHPAVIHGQNASFSYVVQLPVRADDGRLQLQLALISRQADVYPGYLPLTQANVLRQAIKFLGERYGWGHDFNARDCSGFIADLYRSFGLLLPRNTSAQAAVTFGVVTELSGLSKSERLASISKAQPGELFFMPGHVMLLLGHEAGESYFIHDVAGLKVRQADGSFYRSKLNGVSITPLSPLWLKPTQSYLDALTRRKNVVSTANATANAQH